MMTQDEYDARKTLAHRIFGGLPPAKDLHKAYQGADALIAALNRDGFTIVRVQPSAAPDPAGSAGVTE